MELTHGIHQHKQIPPRKATQGLLKRSKEEDSMGFTLGTGGYGAPVNENNFFEFCQCRKFIHLIYLSLEHTNKHVIFGCFSTLIILKGLKVHI
jgi:hypothetical protein